MLVDCKHHGCLKRMLMQFARIIFIRIYIQQYVILLEEVF